ncbi:MAG TPA: hypothetical protein VJK52_01950 [Candidatus Nanoarchaeia archaeon]|nr:hypothetical protein [Candidatus Nanoarchaeia archaeon]
MSTDSTWERDLTEQIRLHPLFLQQCHPDGRDAEQKFTADCKVVGREGISGSDDPAVQILEIVLHEIKFVRGEVVGIGVFGPSDNLIITRVSHPTNHCLISTKMTQELLNVIEPVLKQEKSS